MATKKLIGCDDLERALLQRALETADPLASIAWALVSLAVNGIDTYKKGGD